MKELIIAKRYAMAFIILAKEKKILPQAVENCKNFGLILYEHPEFLNFLKSPEITFREKRSCVESVLRDGFIREFINFITLLIEKQRISLIMDIIDFIRVHYAHGEASSALLRTSYPLDLEMISMIKGRLEKKFGKAINLYLELDADLNGGVSITIGNMMIDGSIRQRLKELKEKIHAVRMDNYGN